MKTPCQEYFLAHTVEEALDILTASDGSARIVSGGSDLFLEIRQGKLPPVVTMVDVTEVMEMCRIEICEGFLFIGASATLSRLVNSSLIKEHAQALADAASLMGNPQVCNIATIGGNIAHALPAADGAIALLALDAQAEVANHNGRYRIPLQALFKGPGISTLDPCFDILVGFYVPLCEAGQASAFARRVNPQGIALAMLNMAIWIERNGVKISNIRIAVGPSGTVPSRMYATERALQDQAPTCEVKAQAWDELLKEAHFRTSLYRATTWYRQHLAEVLLDEVITKAWQRAG